MKPHPTVCVCARCGVGAVSLCTRCPNLIVCVNKHIHTHRAHAYTYTDSVAYKRVQTRGQIGIHTAPSHAHTHTQRCCRYSMTRLRASTERRRHRTPKSLTRKRTHTHHAHMHACSHNHNAKRRQTKQPAHKTHLLVSALLRSLRSHDPIHLDAYAPTS